ncbi:MAG: cytosine permease [Burkholderiaceae bacterium]|jgi:nucleobase:cation symporter-1, NCS1 family|nr:cytosine permease [Burkholderiaceae bacterium]
MASNHSSVNSVLAPVAASERVFTGFSHASLWFSLGVGLLVIQIGAYLVPAMGTQDALLAILLGSLLGSGLVAWVAKLGCDTGLSSAGLMHQVYGSGFAKLPIVLNVIQLVGWTSFELVIMREGTLAMGEKHFAWSGNYLVMATVFWGSILTLLMASSMLGLVRNFVSRFGLPLVVMSLAWLTWQFLGVLQTQDVSAFWNRSGNNSMGVLSAIDLVIAMPVSWLPLVADYARHGKNSRTAMSATWLGYALANIWCYSLGVLVVSVSSPDINLVSTLLLAQGGLLALGLILIDELDNAYGDVYSASLNSHSLFSRWSIKQWGLLIAVGCTLLAIVLPMHSLEPFLLMLSSVFIPLYGVILGRAGRAPASSASRSIYLLPALIWLIGIAVFHLSAQFTPQWGSALPSLAVSLSLAWLTRPNPATGDAAHA